MRSSFAVLALIGAVTQSEVAQAVQKKHHHHHHKHSLAQEPKADEEEAKLNPDDNRKTFDKAVKQASKVVATEVKTENTNTTNIAAANTKATAESNKVFTDVTKARVQQINGEINHRQWVSKNKTGNWVQKSTPDDSRTSYDNHVKETDKVVAEQQKQEKDNVATITDNHNNAAAKASTLQNKVTAARVSQTAGDVPYARDSRGWQLVPPGTGHALAQQGAAEEKKEAAEEPAKEEKKEEAKAAEPAKEEAKAPAKEEAKAPAKEEAKADAAPAKEEAKLADAKEEKKADAAPAKEDAKAEAKDGDAKEAKDGDAKKADAGADEKAPDAAAAKKGAAPKGDEDKEDKVAKGTPDQSYSEKAASLKVVLDTVAEQRRFEQQSNADVAAAQEKYYKKSENEKNTVRVARKIMRDGGLVHDTPMPVEYKIKGYTGKDSHMTEGVSSLAQADPKPAEEKKEAEEQAPPKQNPENAYKEKAASRKVVEKTVADQQAWESRSNKEVHNAQEKYWDQSENQKNDVRIDRRIQANGGLDHREGYQRWPQSLLQKKETPDESRKIFEAHVKEAASVVKTENTIEAKRTTQIAKMDAQNVKDTFDEKARVRSGRVAMTRGGPKTRYSGGHNGKAAPAEAKAAALAQESGSDASSESDSDEEENNAKQHQALQQAIAKKQNKQQAREESSDSSSDSDSD